VSTVKLAYSHSEETQDKREKTTQSWFRHALQHPARKWIRPILWSPKTILVCVSFANNMNIINTVRT